MKYSVLVKSLKEPASKVEIGSINDVINSLEEFEVAAVFMHKSGITDEEKVAHIKDFAKETFISIYSTIRAMSAEKVDSLATTLDRKNHDYGNSFDKVVDKFGDVAMSVRISDKLSRIKQLTKTNNQEVNDESVEDTLIDSLGYLALIINY